MVKGDNVKMRKWENERRREGEKVKMREGEKWKWENENGILLDSKLKTHNS